jgi:hypothetical protein
MPTHSSSPLKWLRRPANKLFGLMVESGEEDQERCGGRAEGVAEPVQGELKTRGRVPYFFKRFQAGDCGSCSTDPCQLSGSPPWWKDA